MKLADLVVLCSLAERNARAATCEAAAAAFNFTIGAVGLRG